MKSVLSVLFVSVLLSASAFAFDREGGHHPGQGHHPGHKGQLCAVVYQAPGFDGARMEVRDGERIGNLGQLPMGHPCQHESWDNRISAMIVMEGCTLTGFQYQNFGRDFYSGRDIGFAERFSGHCNRGREIDLTGTFVENKISSLECFCR